MQKAEKLDQFGRPFPSIEKLWPQPIVAVDAVVIRKKLNSPEEVLLITRLKEGKFKGFYAFPGGHLNYNEEPSKGCLRELMEETNLVGKSCDLLCVKGDPLRDNRGHYISIVYLVSVDDNAIPNPGDDAATAEYHQIKEITKSKGKFAFDHYEILVEACKKLNIPC